ncbi:cytochrome P450 734A1 [Aspergillus udagawae]|nr:cytochrome P450 734A1 [Aspergillus udagawae]GFG16136.1 cytochrome P450 734A1 [Aspergillus udagawae]
MKPEIVITKPEDVKRFHIDSVTHSKARSSNGGWLFHQLLGVCMGLINGQRWKRIRAQFDPWFVQSAIARLADQPTQYAADYIERLEKTLNPGENGSFVVHAAQTFSRFPFMANAEYIYGPLDDDEKEEIWALGQRSLAMMAHVLSGGVHRYKIYRWLKPGTYRQLVEFERDWSSFNERMYNKQRCSDTTRPIVPVWTEVLSGNIPKMELVQTLSEIIFANLDVSTHILTWLIILLAENSGWQARLRDEITATDLTLPKLCARKDTLLHHCFLESIRLRPFTVFTIPASSPQKKAFGHFIIPENTCVVVDNLALSRNGEFWGEDTDEFRPDRFKKLSPTELRYNLYTFGFGTRKCIGQHFGEAIMKQFVCCLLSRYELRLPETEKAASSGYKNVKNTWVPISDARLVLTPRRPAELLV